MTRPEMLRVFIDGRGVDVAPGATALDAVEVFDPAQAGEVRAGTRVITDSRGLPIDSGTSLESGAIFRLIPRRDRSAAPKE